MKLHLTRKGQRMYSANEDNIPIHWFALSQPARAILKDLKGKRALSLWDETALLLLIDIGLVKYD